MKNILSNISILTFMVLLAVACGSKKSSMKITDQYIDSINTHLAHLQDSTSKTWNIMMVEDDTKLKYLNRLLDEISYTKNYNQMRFDSLKSALTNLKDIRYNESSMVTSEIIDQYDMATSSTVSSIISFAREHPNYEEYPIMQELINDITDIDNRVIYRRVDYDNIAIEFNQFVKDNQEIIAKPGIKPKPLFQISQ